MPSALLTFIKFLSRPLFDIGGNSISVITIFVAVLLFWSSTFLSNLSVKLTYRILNKADLERGVRESFAKVSKYLTLFLGIMISLSALGFNLNSIAAISAVLGVGIGFGLQNITQNFMSGLIILFERPIKVGDLVEVNGVSGRVVEINFRSTLIHTRDDVAIIVPNSKFIAEQVVNESFSGEKIRLHLRVGVAYGTDVQKVKEILLKIAQENEGVLMTPPPSVIFEDFADSSLNFKLRVWVKELWTTEDILSELRFQVDKAFKENNISIPFPQRDVWIKEQKKLGPDMLEPNYYMLECRVPDEVDDIARLKAVYIKDLGSWRIGKSFTKELPNPLHIFIKEGYPDTLLEMYSNDALIITKRMYKVLLENGINNMDAYPCVILNKETGFKSLDYIAINLIGLIESVDLEKSKILNQNSSQKIDLDFEGVVIDELKAKNHLMFRLAENTSAIVVHKSIRNALLEAGFIMLTFVDPEIWIG